MPRYCSVIFQKVIFLLVCLSGQVVKAFVILSPHFTGDKDSLVKELQDHVKETTAPYKYPRKVKDFLRRGLIIGRIIASEIIWGAYFREGELYGYF